MIVFENENYVVHTLDGDSEYFLVTFSGLRAEEASRGTFFAEAACRKLGLASAGIVSKNEDWYTSGGIDDAIEIVRTLACKYSVVYGYGSSMGAYCAIKYSRVLNFSACLALAPQWSIAPDEFGHPSQFDPFFRPQMRGMGIRAEQISGLVNILIDGAEKIDLLHAEKIKTIHEKTHIGTLPGCGHNVAPHIKGTRQLQALLSCIENPIELTARARRIRRSNVESLSQSLNKLAERKPNIVFRALKSHRASAIGLTAFIYRNQRQIIGCLAFTMMRAGRKHDALLLVADSLPPIGLSLGHDMRDTKLLLSHIAEYLCYNPITGSLSSSKGTIPTNGFPLATIGSRLVALTWAGYLETGMVAEKLDGTGFMAISKNSRYVSVFPSGHVVNDRSTVNLWEMFLSIPAPVV